jgi:hypothetical protein
LRCIFAECPYFKRLVVYATASISLLDSQVFFP